MKYLVTTSIVAIVSLSLGITLASSSRMKFDKNPDQMETEILRVIPKGTPIADAKKTMEQNSFECEYREKGIFGRFRQIPDSTEYEEQSFDGVDYLYCTHTRGFMVYEKWIVAIFHEKDGVTNVAVNYGLIGL